MVEYLSGGGRRTAFSASVRLEPNLTLRLAAAIALGVLTANCSTPPQKFAGGSRQVDPKYGVVPSRRLYGENDAIPKGGGRNFSGRPYVIAGRTYVPKDDPRGYVREGLASWYGTAFHGRETANGEVFDRFSVAAAHPTLPLPSYARVTNLANGHSMIVRVNDRGPYHENRVMDVSQRVAEALDFRRAGTSRVRVEYVGKASLKGSDDTKLMATLRTDGRSAPLPGQSVMFAAAGEEASPPKPTLVAMASRDAETPEEPFRPSAPAVAAEAPRAARPVRTALAFKPAPTEDEDEPPARATAKAPAPLRLAHGAPAQAMATRMAALAPRDGDERVGGPSRGKTALRDGGRGHEDLHAAKPSVRPPLRLSAPPLQLARALPEPPGRPGLKAAAKAPAPSGTPPMPKLAAKEGHPPLADARAPGLKGARTASAGVRTGESRTGESKAVAARAATATATAKTGGSKTVEAKAAHAAPAQGAPKRAKLAEAR